VVVIPRHLVEEVAARAIEQERRERLMITIDGLNRRYGRGTVQWAACGLQPGWAMRRGQLSRAATTRLKDLPTVWAH